jgi:hypothetical protein
VEADGGKEADEMTTEKTARILALIAASQARIEGMKAENEQRLLLGESIAYGFDEFNGEASELKGLIEDMTIMALDSAKRLEQE